MSHRPGGEQGFRGPAKIYPWSQRSHIARGQLVPARMRDTHLASGRAREGLPSLPTLHKGCTWERVCKTQTWTLYGSQAPGTSSGQTLRVQGIRLRLFTSSCPAQTPHGSQPARGPPCLLPALWACWPAALEHGPPPVPPPRAGPPPTANIRNTEPRTPLNSVQVLALLTLCVTVIITLC